MSRPTVLLVALTLAAMAVGMVASFQNWRNGKLAVLAPRALAGEAQWSGPRGAGCRLLMIGDSRIAQWPLAAPAGWEVGRLGFPGEASGNILAAAAPVVARERPDAVLVQAGTNDATAAALAPEQAEHVLDAAAINVGAILDAAHAAGARALIAITIAPPIEPSLLSRLAMGDRQSDTMRALSARLARVAQTRGAALIDAEEVLRNRSGGMDPAHRADDLHWRPSAYQALNRARDRILASSPCAA